MFSIAGTAEQTAWAAAALEQAKTKRDLPALADPSALLMPLTALENTFTTQSQNRNLNGRIFGGFLMRRAFELAHATAHLLSAVRPRPVLVDEIHFKRPVDVGDLVKVKSRVLRTWPLPGQPGKAAVHTQVQAEVIKPEELQSFETNTFNFYFIVNLRKDERGEFKPLAKVWPATESQALEVCSFYGPGSEAQHDRHTADWGKEDAAASE